MSRKGQICIHWWHGGIYALALQGFEQLLNRGLAADIGYGERSPACVYVSIVHPLDGQSGIGGLARGLLLGDDEVGVCGLLACIVGHGGISSPGDSLPYVAFRGAVGIVAYQEVVFSHVWSHAVDALHAVESGQNLVCALVAVHIVDVQAHLAQYHLVGTVGSSLVSFRGIECRADAVGRSLLVVEGNGSGAPLQIEVVAVDALKLVDYSRHLLCAVCAAHTLDAHGQRVGGCGGRCAAGQ